MLVATVADYPFSVFVETLSSPTASLAVRISVVVRSASACLTTHCLLIVKSDSLGFSVAHDWPTFATATKVLSLGIGRGSRWFSDRESSLGLLALEFANRSILPRAA